jgi:GGDEF domain-containing protein
MVIDRLRRQLGLRSEGIEPAGDQPARPPVPDSPPEAPVAGPAVAPQQGRHRSAPDSSVYDPIFEGLRQPLSDGSDVVPAVAAAGRRLAERGIPLVDALYALRSAYHKAGGGELPFEAIRVLCQSWTECALTYLQTPSCEDPVTGLATTPHLRSRLNELYRKAELGGWYVADTHALVIAEPIVAVARLNEDDQLIHVAESVRTVFKEAEVVARLGLLRVAAVVRLEPQFTEQLGTLRSMISYQGDAPDQAIALEPSTKIWSERFPTLSEWSDAFVSDLAGG